MHRYFAPFPQAVLTLRSPSMSGSPRSSRTTSGWRVAISISPCCPVSASWTLIVLALENKPQQPADLNFVVND